MTSAEQKAYAEYLQTINSTAMDFVGVCAAVRTLRDVADHVERVNQFAADFNKLEAPFVPEAIEMFALYRSQIAAAQTAVSEFVAKSKKSIENALTANDVEKASKYAAAYVRLREQIAESYMRSCEQAVFRAQEVVYVYEKRFQPAFEA